MDRTSLYSSFNDRNIGYRDKLQFTPVFVEHQCAAIFRNQAVLRLRNANHVPIVEPERIGLKGTAIIDFQQTSLASCRHRALGAPMGQWALVCEGSLSYRS